MGTKTQDEFNRAIREIQREKDRQAPKSKVKRPKHIVRTLLILFVIGISIHYIYTHYHELTYSLNQDNSLASVVGSANQIEKTNLSGYDVENMDSFVEAYFLLYGTPELDISLIKDTHEVLQNTTYARKYDKLHQYILEHYDRCVNYIELEYGKTGSRPAHYPESYYNDENIYELFQLIDEICNNITITFTYHYNEDTGNFEYEWVYY